jgi:cation diffusion facilitator family transporter
MSEPSYVMKPRNRQGLVREPYPGGTAVVTPPEDRDERAEDVELTRLGASASPVGASTPGRTPTARSRTSSAAFPNWRQNVTEWKDLVPFAKGAERSDPVKKYYKRQNKAIQQYLELDALQQKTYGNSTDPIPDLHARHIADEDEDPVAFWGKAISLIMNVCLLGLKTWAVVQSGSLTVAASLVDSALDLFAGGVLVLVAFLRRRLASEDYPTGKHRFEPLGTLIFACGMCVASAKLIEASATELAGPASDVGGNINDLTFIIVGVVIFVKLIAWIIYSRIRDVASSIDALADDHRNDVFSNAFGLGAIAAARYWWPYIDPIVAMLTAVVIMILWSRAAYFQVQALSGRLAPPQILNSLTLLARNHDPRVIAVDTVRAVTGGEGFIVEIDLVLPPDMKLQEAHDIGESFQVFLEGLKELEIARAYVHLDYETAHDPREHR